MIDIKDKTEVLETSEAKKDVSENGSDVQIALNSENQFNDIAPAASEFLEEEEESEGGVSRYLTKVSANQSEQENQPSDQEQSNEASEAETLLSNFVANKPDTIFNNELGESNSITSFDASPINGRSTFTSSELFQVNIIGGGSPSSIFNRSSIGRDKFTFAEADTSGDLSGSPIIVPDPFLASFISNPGADRDFFGRSAAATSEYLIIAAPVDDNSSTSNGTVYVYDAVTGEILQTIMNPETMGGWFGGSVDIEGDNLLIGARFNDPGASNSGAAYIYNAVSGALVQTLVNPDVTANDYFGSEVKIEGNYALVSAPRDDIGATDTGSVYVYDVTTGGLLYTLNNPSADNGDLFGAIAVDGNYIIVGAESDDTDASGAGIAYIYDLATGASLFTLNNPAPLSGEGFGTSAAIDGNLAAVSEWYDSSAFYETGAVHIYDVTTGTLLRTIDNPSPLGDDGFGYVMDIQGNYGAFGTYETYIEAEFSGGAFVYDITTGDLLHSIRNPNPEPNDYFASSLVIEGNNLYIGADEKNVNGALYVALADFTTTGVLEGTSGNDILLALGHGEIITGGDGADLFSANIQGSITIKDYNPTEGDFIDLGNIGDLGFASYSNFTDYVRVQDMGADAVIQIDIDGAAGGVNYVDWITLANEAGNYNTRHFFEEMQLDEYYREVINDVDFIRNPTPQYYDLFGEFMAVNSTYLAAAQIGFLGVEEVHVFDKATGALVRTISDTGTVALDGANVIIGNPDAMGTFAGEGVVTIYDITTGAVVRTFVNPNPTALDEFGSSIAVNGSNLVIGARADDAGASGAGIAYIFDKDTGALLHTLNNPAPNSFDYFGETVAITGNYVIIGAVNDDTAGSNSGSAYVFDATTGTLLYTFNHPLSEAFGGFGTDIYADGNYVIISERDGAHVYDLTTGTLVQSFSDTPVKSVAIEGNYAIVGDFFADASGSFDNAGAIYIYDIITGNLLQEVLNPNRFVSDYLGTDIVIDGNNIFVSAEGDDTGETYTGAVIEMVADFDGDNIVNTTANGKTLIGLEGDDTLNGDASNNVLYGGDDNDTLIGGGGLDRLYGGAGSDIFVFENTSAFDAIDTVEDFSVAQSDVIDISDVLVGYNFGVDDIADFARLIDNGADAILQIDEDGAAGGSNFEAIALIIGGAGLDAATLEGSGHLDTVI